MDGMKRLANVQCIFVWWIFRLPVLLFYQCKTTTTITTNIKTLCVRWYSFWCVFLIQAALFSSSCISFIRGNCSLFLSLLSFSVSLLNQFVSVQCGLHHVPSCKSWKSFFVWIGKRLILYIFLSKYILCTWAK